MISIGVLTYCSTKKLEATLITYKKAGLFYLTDDIFVVIQMSHLQEEERLLCESFGIRSILLPDNGNMASGFKAIYEGAKHEYILFLENDFVINATEIDTENFYQNCLYFLKEKNFDIVRGRSRVNAGVPNYAYENLRGIDQKEFINHYHLAECIYWIENPELVYPEKISRIEPLVGKEKWYFSTAESCAYTNNPYACSKHFFEKNILPHLKFGENIEGVLVDIWSKKNYRCIFGPGLFTHGI